MTRHISGSRRYALRSGSPDGQASRSASSRRRFRGPGPCRQSIAARYRPPPVRLHRQSPRRRQFVQSNGSRARHRPPRDPRSTAHWTPLRRRWTPPHSRPEPFAAMVPDRQRTMCPRRRRRLRPGARPNFSRRAYFLPCHQFGNSFDALKPSSTPRLWKQRAPHRVDVPALKILGRAIWFGDSSPQHVAR